MTAAAPPRQWWIGNEFAAFLPHLRAVAAHDVRAGKHARIELSSSCPWHLTQQALAFRAPCVACGRTVAVFRARRAPAKRGRSSGNVYLSVSCALADNMACARGRSASVAYDSIESLIADSRPPTAPQGALL